MASKLVQLRERLRRRKPPARKSARYSIPHLWHFSNPGGTKPVKVNPFDYFSSAIGAVLRRRPPRLKKGAGGSWTKEAVIYNMFLRTTAAFDHNQNGRLDLPVNGDGWRETGTFLKAISMLPMIRSLGANTVHLLPITSIGADGNKGSLGSPYAIRNPYNLDAHLAEPALDAGPHEEFAAFVEGAHRLGLRVVVEFVFRTAAKDGDWVKEHPEWFYWIKADIPDRPPGSKELSQYGNPVFTPEELHEIKSRVERHELANLPPPHALYRSMFTEPPRPETIVHEHGGWRGMLPDGTRVRIPGAFADWPPDDMQPPWGDVTYLKMYDHPDFNYIAYNTIRMYDSTLARPENMNAPLWEKITGIIPHYQKEYGIDGVMIDMGHALPAELKKEMIRKAREIDPDFAFWDENFSVTRKSVDEGYNAVFGYQWADLHHPLKFSALVDRFAGEGFPIPHFATPENHNTPRAAMREGGARYSKYAWAVGNFLPAVPFIHSGFETGEEWPINTGLDFTREQLAHYPSEKLPLFSEYAYAWNDTHGIARWVRRVSAVREKHRHLIIDPDPSSFRRGETGNSSVIAFWRGKTNRLLVIANSDMKGHHRCSVAVHTKKRKVKDLLGGSSFPVSGGHVKIELSPGQVVVFEG